MESLVLHLEMPDWELKLKVVVVPEWHSGRGMSDGDTIYVGPGRTRDDTLNSALLIDLLRLMNEDKKARGASRPLPQR